MNIFEIYLERGQKRTFAGALDWPGWCRLGRSEELALLALLEAGPRYASALALEGIDFLPPVDAAAFTVAEHLAGNATTDFGAPDAVPAADSRSFDQAALKHSQAILRACWQAFDRAVQAARGKALRKGPRGGGRSLEGVMEHVLGAEHAYLSRLAWMPAGNEASSSFETLQEALQRSHQAALHALENAARGGLPEIGPRGGKLWKPRYFVRRSAWHILDHAWELEDRIE